jgi:hypothetical protein
MIVWGRDCSHRIGEDKHREWIRLEEGFLRIIWRHILLVNWEEVLIKRLVGR